MREDVHGLESGEVEAHALGQVAESGARMPVSPFAPNAHVRASRSISVSFAGPTPVFRPIAVPGAGFRLKHP